MKVVMAQISSGSSVPTTTPTLGTFLEEWFNRNSTQWRAATQRNYRGSIDLYLKPALGTIRLEKLTPTVIQRWIDEHHGQNGARRRVSLAHAVLRSALGEAERLEIVASNAARKVKLPSIKTSKIEPFSPEEAARFIQEASKHRLGALFTLTLACGLRSGEVLGLTWESIDLDNATLAVERQLQYVGKEPKLQPLKTHKSRRKLGIPAFAVTALHDHRARQREEMFAAGPNASRLGLVFTTYAREGNGRKLGTPQHPRNVTRVFNQILKNAGLRKIRFHDLRHSAASLLISKGMQLVQVSQLLGHSESRVTADFDGHLQPETAASAARQMDAIFGAVTG